jgi:hypothetical protein
LFPLSSSVNLSMKYHTLTLRHAYQS